MGDVWAQGADETGPRVGAPDWLVAERVVLSLARARVLGPQRGLPTVSDDHLEWHTRQVF